MISGVATATPYLKLMAVGDSPTAETGFARVMKNVLPRWLKVNGGPFDEISVWAINYAGERHSLPFWIYNGGSGGDWQSATNLYSFLTVLSGKAGGEFGRAPFTHLWMMQDSFCLSGHKFPEGLKKITDALKIRSVYYMPVDAALDPQWMDIVQNVDATVAYTHYGKAEALKALPRTYNPASISVLPHGCDTAIYRPMADRMEVRHNLFKPAAGQKAWALDEDFLIVNINANQRRKDIPRSMRIFRELVERSKASPLPNGGRFKMLFHMPNKSPDGYDLSKLGQQLGLVENVDWVCSDRYFHAGFAKLPEDSVAQFYNAADLMLTTTLGEGWGFCLTEALGCGCPIAAPEHTSCLEIMRQMAEMGCEVPVLPLPVEPFSSANAFDNSRFRDGVNAREAVDSIFEYANADKGSVVSPRRPEDAPAERPYQTKDRKDWGSYTASAKEWLSWDRIAKEWEKIILGDEKSVASQQQRPTKEPAPPIL